MIQATLQDRTGRRLEHVYFEEHEPRDKPSSRSILSIWLEFAGFPLLHVFGTADGWRLCTDDAQPRTTIEMDEYGRIEVVDESRSDSIFRDVIGSDLSQFWTIQPRDGNEVVGLRLKFGERNIYIVNWDDDLHIGYDYPPRMTRSEFTEQADD